MMLNTYVQLSYNHEASQELVDMVLALCRTIVEQSRGEEKREDDEWPEFELPEA